jgi:hypothetical protein
VRSGPGSWDRGLRTSLLSSYRSGAPHVPMRARYLGMASTGPDPPGGPAPPRVGARPLWACLSSWPRGPNPLFPPGRGPVSPRATKVVTPGSALPRARGRRPSAGRQPNNCIKCGLVGGTRPSQSMVCPTDTTVCPPVTKTARHCALCAGRWRVVPSRRHARE